MQAVVYDSLGEVWFSCLVSVQSRIDSLTMFITGGRYSKPCGGHTEPFRGFSAVLKDADVDRRTLSQQGVQPAIMNHRGIRRENRRLHRWTTCVRQAPM